MAKDTETKDIEHIFVKRTRIEMKGESANILKMYLKRAAQLSAATMLAVIVAVSCGNGGTGGNGKSGANSSKSENSKIAHRVKADSGHENVTRKFPMVKFPAVLGSADEISEYLAEHYFDKFTAVDKSSNYLCDSLHIAGVSNDDFEQAFANYCAILDNVPLETARKGMARLFDRIAACHEADSTSNIFSRTVDVVDRYLYDPNSPMRNEDYYCPFAEKKSHYAGYEDWQREKFAREARLSALNRVGTKAADFVFADKTGKRHRLYGIKADKIILFFSNPGCKACAEIIEALKSYTQMEDMIASGELAVLNIYIDEDRANWYEYMPIYPDSWYNGYDPDYAIRTEILYDVRAIPSLYLLDADKTVLMKDAPVERVLPEVFKY